MELPCIVTATANGFPPLNRIALLTRLSNRTIIIYIARSPDKIAWEPYSGFDYVEDIKLHKFYKLYPAQLTRTLTDQLFTELIKEENEIKK